MNAFTFIGRIVKAATISTNKDGSHRATFRIAVGDNHKNRAGEYGTQFIDLQAFIPAGKKTGSYEALQVGSLVEAKGQLRTSSFAKNGETVYRTSYEVQPGGLTFIAKAKGKAMAPAMAEVDEAVC
jgi:single-stranded DNA-binding protein